MSEELLTISGMVENIVYYNEENGYIVLELDVAGELVTVVGELPGIAAGEEIAATGKYTSHPTYGMQFRAEYCERKLPATAAAIEKYLASGAIRGIGPRFARRIVKTFGDTALSVIEKEPERLAQIPGISEKKAKQISEEYQHIFGIRSVMMYLSQFAIEPAASIRVWKQWGLLTPEVVAEDPYRLCCEQIGVGFEKADEIATQLQFDATSSVRLRAGIVHVLTHNLNNGHTCLPVDKLLQTSGILLEVDTCLLEDALEQAIEGGTLVSDSCDGQTFIYLPAMYESETYIASRIDMMLRTAPPISQAKDYSKEISRLEKQQGIEYALQQRRAINMALANHVFILTGGPGTGKTTTLNAILSILEEEGEKVALAAPTGRAAKRMSEVTGREAQTIHRLLEVDFRNGNEQLSFKRNEKNPLRVGTVILDEVSMVDTRLLHSLMLALKLSCRLILVGDPDQLPSVGAGNILKDLIDSDVVPTVHLDEIFRQAQESCIVANAHCIVHGDNPDLTTRDNDFFFLQRSSYEATAQTVVDLCARRLPKAYGFSPQFDIQVITPSRVGALGTTELNRLLQAQLNPPAPGKTEQKFGSFVFREQDKVMQIRNNYDIAWRRDDDEPGTGIFNGDIGIIEMIDRPSQTMLVRFDDRVAEYNFDMAHEMEHAYAITVHKSQGSEFEAVIMPLMRFHPRLYYRNILYTGVTRARKLMIVLGQPETIFRMVASHRKVLRYTNLARFLTESVYSNNESETFPSP